MKQKTYKVCGIKLPQSKLEYHIQLFRDCLLEAIRKGDHSEVAYYRFMLDSCLDEYYSK